jgi:2-hydroxychromene-2-carboxylate isomerase/ketosteroid isomerase-like protein
MPRLDFWCELASTYTYLSAMRIDALAGARGVDVAWKPFSLAPIFAARGLTTSPFNLELDKGTHMWRDVARQAAALGRPFRRPSAFPRNTIGALRLAVLGVERSWGPAFIRSVLRANFEQDRAIDQDTVLDELLAEVGLDGKSTRDEAVSPEWKPRLRAETEHARTLGVFGAPTFVADGELFWGNDRLENAVDWLTGGGEPRETRGDDRGRPESAPGGDDPIAGDLVAMEHAALVRWCAGDPSGFLEICAPDVVYFDPFVSRRLDGIAALTAHYEALRDKITASRFEILNPHVQRSGDLAVLTFNFVSFGGNENGLRWNCTEVFRREPAGFRLIQTHWSFTDSRPAAPPARTR